MLELLILTGLAQQPLEEHLAAAQGIAADGLLADADIAAVRSARGETVGGLAPRVTATAGYTRNQFAVEATFPDGSGALQTATITAQDQLDATARIDIPLLDIPAWARWTAANADLRSARAKAAGVDQQIQLEVCQAWFQVVAARAVLTAAQAAQTTATANEAVLQSRTEAGITSELDLQRATADRARADQEVADAELQIALAERHLVVLSGLPPDATEVQVPDPIAEEPPLEAWTARLEDIAELRAAAEAARAARSRKAAAGTALVPSVGAFASERWTNASGFGPQASWAAGVQAEWRLDLAKTASLNGASQGAIRAEIEERAARQRLETALLESWHRVRSLTKRVVATREAEVASNRGFEVAQARFSAGTGSQLDLSTALRDRFRGQVDRIRAEVDLHIERRVLRLTSGLPPDLGVNP